MSESDLTAHMTQARDSLVALLPLINPPNDPLAQATNASYQSHLGVVISADPSLASSAADAARILPWLSADGFVAFQSEPTVEMALLQRLTDQANQHLASGHVSIETLRDPSSTVSM